jgi:hypothetical protein
MAQVGASRDPRDLSRAVLRELRRRGYDVVPVHPGIGELEGVQVFGRVGEIDPPVEGALLMTPPHATEEVVRECAAAGISRVWMHRGVGRGAVSEAAVAFCHERGIAVVEGACPFMFLPRAGFVHRSHGFFARLFGSHPEKRAA